MLFGLKLVWDSDCLLHVNMQCSSNEAPAKIRGLNTNSF